MCLTYPVSSRATCSYLFSLFEEWREIEKRCGEESLGMLPLNLHAREEGCSARIRDKAEGGALKQCWAALSLCCDTAVAQLWWHKSRAPRTVPGSETLHSTALTWSRGTSTCGHGLGLASPTALLASGHSKARNIYPWKRGWPRWKTVIKNHIE